VAEGDQPLDRLALALEDGLDGSLRGVSHPSGDPALLREPPRRVAEEDALDAAVDDEAAADHGRTVR
jgi:hypothetical protein